MLKRREFTENLLSCVSHFDCGGASWAQEGARWLKAPAGPDVDPDDSALRAMEEWGTKVWLYEIDSPVDPSKPDAPQQSLLVGYGAVGITNWKVPTGKEAGKVKIGIIPWVCIAREFQGKPDGPPEERYSSRILEDLIAEARDNWESGLCGPWLGLTVDPNNSAAVGCYKRHGFVEMPAKYQGLLKMLIRFE